MLNIREQFLWLLKNRIAWRLWYKAGIATATFLFLAMYSFSFWSILLFCIGIPAIFFVQRDDEKNEEGILFFLFLILSVIALWFLVFKTSFFLFWGSPQFGLFGVLFCSFLFLFYLTTNNSWRYEERVSLARTAILLFSLLMTSFLYTRYPLFSYGVLFLSVVITTQDFCSAHIREKSLITRGYALISGLVVLELFFALKFVPFIFPIHAAILTVFLVLFWDLLEAHKRGILTQALLIQKISLFLAFFIVSAIFTKWTV